MTSTPVIWALDDGRAGNVSQVIGVANALELPYLRQEIHYTPWARLPNVVRQATCIGITTEAIMHSLHSPSPAVVITAGRKAAPFVRWLKRRYPALYWVQLMWPDVGMKECDLLVLPEHDRRHLPAALETKVLYTLTTPHLITPEVLHKAAAMWRPLLQTYASPRYAVLIGGSTKQGAFSMEHAEDLLRHLHRLHTMQGGSLLVTVSRRTEEKVRNYIKTHLPEGSYFYAPGDKGENPYQGMLAIADNLIVTGDSMSMCSEAIATGKPTYIYSSHHFVPLKHQRFHHAIYHQVLAFPLEMLHVARPPQEKPVINSAFVIAQEIRKRFIGE